MKKIVNEYPIELNHFGCNYGKLEAVSDLCLTVKAGRCYGLFGRNGAGKTTTIRCLLNLIRPTKGQVRLFGRNAGEDEVYVKSHLAYVGDQVAFYPWMSVRDVCDYMASFRPQWNHNLEKKLISYCELNETARANDMSRGQKVQLALICAICSRAELLVLDEPTSGLDPIMRRDFIKMIIGEFQDECPEQRTVFVSTHLISEFEGLIDEFTILHKGSARFQMEADEARQKYCRYLIEFSGSVPSISAPGIITLHQSGNTADIVMCDPDKVGEKMFQTYNPLLVRREALTLEEIFIAVLGGNADKHDNPKNEDDSRRF